MIKSIINVEAPRPQVFSVLTDYPRYSEWLPGCERSTVLKADGHMAETEIVINSMKRMTLGLRFEAQPDQVLMFRMVSGKDIKAYQGSYRLIDSADGSGTVVVAELEIDAGPMAPRFLVDRMAKKAIADTGVALNKHVATLPPAAAPARRKVELAPSAPHRHRRVLQVINTPEGPRVWYMGRLFTIQE